MANARQDVWGEAAIRNRGGPSYEFFEKLLPPLRYVNAEFRHYPMVLSAPAGPMKARWVSNGSGVNLRANKPPMWRDFGTPVAFFVGDSVESFGNDLARLDGPRYVAGHLPVVQVRYEAGGTLYEQEVFAIVRQPWSDYGAVFVRFLSRQRPGQIAVRVRADAKVMADSGAVRNEMGGALMLFGPEWRWNGGPHELRASLDMDKSATLLTFVRPSTQADAQLPDYDDERHECLRTWQAILKRGADFQIPEPLVQNVWQALVIGNYLLANADHMNYSAGNAYDKLYEGECGDAVRALMLLGQTADARRMVGPLLDFNRQATRFHVAGHKLQLLAHYYWTSRDAAYLQEKRPVWEPVIEFIRSSRRTENGLLPKDNYAGDISQQVYSLNSNANCWRGLRDMAAVLEDLHEKPWAAQLRQEAAEFRQLILKAVSKSEHREIQPPFIPISLLGDEPAHDPLTATRLGSYYDLMAPYVLGSGVFGPGSEREQWMIDYLRQHGGVAMGMIRSMPHQGEFDGQAGVNVLYGQRYLLTLLRRGDREHAAVGFYGQLAQAMTRDTFIGGEGSRFFHGDARGRSFYLPPNSASNAMFLTTLRYLLIQDWDLDDDGRPDTLRLFDAVPPRWLASGSKLAVLRAPSMFGELSMRVESQLDQGIVAVSIEAPPRAPPRWTLRIPNPPGHVVTAATIEGQQLRRDPDGRFDLSGKTGSFTVRIQCGKRDDG